MRIIAIPIARARLGASPVSTFLAQKTPIKSSFIANRPSNDGNPSQSPSTSESNTTKDGEASVSSTSSAPAEKKEPISKRIMTKAAEFWIDLGREDQKSTFDWKRRTYNLGEKLMDRIEYEEWALKGVDPTIGPSLRSPTKSKEVETKDEKSSTELKTSSTKSNTTVSLLYPPSLLTSSSLLSSLTHLTSSRQPHHRQRIIWCIVGMPLTIPFIVVPIIPNLPFFYLVWRAWSHWRAFQSSKYLSDLINQGRLIPTPSEELDRIFSQIESSQPSPSDKPPPSSKVEEQSSSSTTTEQEQPKVSQEELESMMILKPIQITKLVETFKFDRQASVDLSRARQQTIKAIKSGQIGKLEEAAKHGAGHDKKKKE